MTSFKEILTNYRDLEDVSAQYRRDDIDNSKGICILSYIGWLVFFPLFMEKENPAARFHCNQGLALAIAESLIYITLRVVELMCGVPIIGWLFWIVRAALWLCEALCVLFSVYGVIAVSRGQMKVLPVFGKMKLLK